MSALDHLHRELAGLFARLDLHATACGACSARWHGIGIFGTLVRLDYACSRGEPALATALDAHIFAIPGRLVADVVVRPGANGFVIEALLIEED